MREIEFRAKRVDSGEWVYGYYTSCKRSNAINGKCDNPPDSDPMWKEVLISYEVRPETVGQYTGLKDKNGVKIYEGDIVTIAREDEEDLFAIEWDEDSARFICECDTFVVDFDSYYGYECEIVGNVVDNAELLKGVE